jgi:hypothetical protein
LFAGEGTGGVDLVGSCWLVGVLIVSSTLGSSGLWLAIVALAICGLGDDLLAA